MTGALPKARVSPETNTVGGITFEDPYQWLEATTEDTTRWQSAQDDAAREYIRAWPGWRTLRDAVERSTNAGQGFVFPAYHDGLWISGRDLSGASRILEGKELATVQVLDGPAGKAIETLLDLNEVPHTKPIQLGGLALSPDKHVMSYSILEGGGEKPLIRIVDRTSGAVLLDGLGIAYTPPLVCGSVPTWLPHSDTLFYVALVVEAPAVPALRLFRFHLGSRTTGDF
jgi:prolyl oligopeptidase